MMTLREWGEFIGLSIAAVFAALIGIALMFAAMLFLTPLGWIAMILAYIAWRMA